MNYIYFISLQSRRIFTISICISRRMLSKIKQEQMDWFVSSSRSTGRRICSSSSVGGGSYNWRDGGPWKQRTFQCLAPLPFTLLVTCIMLHCWTHFSTRKSKIFGRGGQGCRSNDGLSGIFWYLCLRKWKMILFLKLKI